MDKIEKLICDTIDANSDRIIEFGRDIWHHAELGYREFRTSQKFVEALNSLGLETETGLAITGVKSYLKEKGSTNGPTIALQGELDALPMPNHKDANPETGAAHCCGHHAQLTGVFGAAIALTIPEVRDALDGNIVFMALPNEESVDLKYNESLKEKGLIKYFGGKCEFIRLGLYDDIDMFIDNHSGPNKGPHMSNGHNNGFTTKVVKFHGIAAHAGAAPFRGCDAQEAANIAMHAIDAQRETFREKDGVRIHGHIVKTSPAPNTIADEVEMVYSVRARNLEAIKQACAKFDRSMRAGAIAMGCGLTIETKAGYLPRHHAGDMSVFEEVFEMVHGKYPYEVDRSEPLGNASSDEGDISSIKPLFMFHTGGISGSMHGLDFDVADEYHLYVLTAKIFALSAYRFLRDGAVRAKEIIDNFKPLMTKEEYLAYMENMSETQEYPMEPILSSR